MRGFLGIVSYFSARIIYHERDWNHHSMSPSAIVHKLWNYCNVLRDDGMSYGDYPSALLRTGPSTRVRQSSETRAYLFHHAFRREL